MCDHLRYESVYFKELYTRSKNTIYRAGEAAVSTITRYTFKMFLRFWFAKIPRITSYCWLKWNNFAICEKWRQLRGLKLPENWTVNRVGLGTRLSCFGTEYVQNGISLEIGELLAKTWREQQEDNLKDDICYYIWRIFEELNNLLSPKLVDRHALSKLQTVDELSSDGGKHVLTCF